VADFTDQDLIHYVRTHSETPRALFHVKMLNRMFEMAERPEHLEGDGFVAYKSYDGAHQLCNEAQEKLDARSK